MGQKTAANPLYCSVQINENIVLNDSTSSPGSLHDYDEYEINPHHLCIHETLGEGAFGHVVRGEIMEGPQWMKNQIMPITVAVKMVKGTVHCNYT
jgi:hypothetical protein